MRRNLLSMMNMKKLFNISPLSIGDVFTVGLKTGLCIETTLQEILGICPREKVVVMLTKGLQNI